MSKKKAILVLDMPESCKGCMCYVLGMSNNFCGVTNFAIFDNTAKPDWCPLKPVPEKMDVDEDEDIFGWYDRGWNACVREILDEQN